MRHSETIGKVILAAAGPGDPELVTVKAVRWLQQADVILVDRLVSPDILREHANADAQIIEVGKQCGRGLSTPQETINELMTELALNGKLVVRLKGGDVSIFSNILDELRVLAENEVPYEIVPGVTAALGAAAYSGIPLTARDYSRAVRFLTFYKSSVLTEAYWKDLARTEDTLVFYMSSTTLSEVVNNLVKHHIAGDKLLAVIEQATTPMQHVHITAIDRYERELKHKVFASPSLVIIGKVVALHNQFKWFANSGATESYFKPLTEIPVSESKKESHVNAA
jgi:uroporphyrin-III C-methyltransferase/precorrin-2 dehydrogenase/sirohydrochlorin ferrochelatase/uroporphyrin-III C-methyltransferase